MKKNMKRQIWPIILYCGWFFMVPRMDKGNILDNLPVSNWTHMSSHDAAINCERAKTDLFSSLQKNNRSSLQMEAVLIARCIPADSISTHSK